MFLTRVAVRSSRFGSRGSSLIRIPQQNKRGYEGYGRRFQSTFTGRSAYDGLLPLGLALIGAGGSLFAFYEWDLKYRVQAKSHTPDYDAIRKEIADVLESNPNYDDGSYGPIIVRLAWHSSGTYDKSTNTGGSNGGLMRFSPESGWGANAGLNVAREVLEPIKKRHPEISYGDLWTLAGVVAIKEMGGPDIKWRPGRVDFPDGKKSPPDGRLPDGAKGQDHIREIFYRMGFNDREIVALLGAHSIGRCHKQNSGYDGPWTKSPTMFSNEFYRELLENTWTKKNWKGPFQYEDKEKELMMLPADMALIKDKNFRKYVELYAKDEDVFFEDFAKAFGKLLELGVPFGR